MLAVAKYNGIDLEIDTFDGFGWVNYMPSTKMPARFPMFHALNRTGQLVIETWADDYESRIAFKAGDRGLVNVHVDSDIPLIGSLYDIDDSGEPAFANYHTGSPQISAIIYKNGTSFAINGAPIRYIVANDEGLYILSNWAGVDVDGNKFVDISDGERYGCISTAKVYDNTIYAYDSMLGEIAIGDPRSSLAAIRMPCEYLHQPLFMPGMQLFGVRKGDGIPMLIDLRDFCQHTIQAPVCGDDIKRAIYCVV